MPTSAFAKPLRICLTGGPCAGKTSVTELIKRQYAKEFEVVAESASLLYGGGFPRAHSSAEMKQVQAAIFHVQQAAENIAALSYGAKSKLGLRGYLFDRGTVDGAAYWPVGGGSGNTFFAELGTTEQAEFARYDCVIHMESATEQNGYTVGDGIRTETPIEAIELDRRIQEAWLNHPQRFVVSSRASFLEKVDDVVKILKRALEGQARD